MDPTPEQHEPDFMAMGRLLSIAAACIAQVHEAVHLQAPAAPLFAPGGCLAKHVRAPGGAHQQAPAADP